MTGVQIEPMEAKDWEAVSIIYGQGIATSQATFEADLPRYEEWDEAHLPFGRLVGRHRGMVVGWAALSPVSRRAVYAGVAEVSVYVSTASRGAGIGRKLLEALVIESERNDIWTLQASIFPENVASVAVHRACGFREVGRRELIGKLNGVWRSTILLERRSTTVV